LWKVRVKKQITIIVDVGDNNFLAQLTVALQLNQGVRQRLYIVAGVLFFRDFILSLSKDSFAQAKERTLRKKKNSWYPSE